MAIRGTGVRGFTLIELLVSVLIVAILLSVAIPLFISSVSDSEVKTCHTNMQTIAGAVQAKRVHDTAPNYSASIIGGLPVLQPDLGSVVCPQGGTYTIENGSSGDGGTFKVSCSVAAHGAYEPGH